MITWCVLFTKLLLLGRHELYHLQPGVWVSVRVLVHGVECIRIALLHVNIRLRIMLLIFMKPAKVGVGLIDTLAARWLVAAPPVPPLPLLGGGGEGGGGCILTPLSLCLLLLRRPTLRVHYLFYV